MTGHLHPSIQFQPDPITAAPTGLRPYVLVSDFSRGPVTSEKSPDSRPRSAWYFLVAEFNIYPDG